MLPPDTEARAWAKRAPEVPEEWFLRYSSLHGVRHTQRVHIHAQRLLGELGWDEADAASVLRAALWHDIGRTGDGVEPRHGAHSAARADELGLTAELTPADAAVVVGFAICLHSLPDHRAAAEAAALAEAEDEARRLADPERALRFLWLLKDADALDRIRLGFGECADPGQLRHPVTESMIPFAAGLFAAFD
jgi:HD superfamily phosphodiesterase